MSHTPGPWEIGYGPHGITGPTVGMANLEKIPYQLVSAPDASLPSGCNRQVCVLFSPQDPEQQDNARLIAAAPELLEALVQLRKILRNDLAVQGREYVSLGVQVNNAIAKATGGQQ